MKQKIGNGKKIVLAAHCLLNPNAKVWGLSNDGGASERIAAYLQEGTGIIQLPCVEMDMCGVMRWGHVKNQFDYPMFRRRCRELLEPIVNQVEDYLEHGFECAGIIGVDGSPTCGVNVTAQGHWYGDFVEGNNYEEKINSAFFERGKGIMMEELSAMLAQRNITIPFESVSEENIFRGDRT